MKLYRIYNTQNNHTVANNIPSYKLALETLHYVQLDNPQEQYAIESYTKTQTPLLHSTLHTYTIYNTQKKRYANEHIQIYKPYRTYYTNRPRCQVSSNSYKRNPTGYSDAKPIATSDNTSTGTTTNCKHDNKRLKLHYQHDKHSIEVQYIRTSMMKTVAVTYQMMRVYTEHLKTLDVLY